MTRRVLITLTWLFGGLFIGFNAMIAWKLYLLSQGLN